MDEHGSWVCSPFYERIKSFCPEARIAVKPHRQCFFIAHMLGKGERCALLDAGFTLSDTPDGGTGLMPPAEMIERALEELPAVERNGEPFDYISSLILRAMRRAADSESRPDLKPRHIETALWATDAPRICAHAEKSRARYLGELSARMELLLDEPNGGSSDALLGYCARALNLVYRSGSSIKAWK